MIGRVEYMRFAFPRRIAKVCEKFVNFERIFQYEPSVCVYICVCVCVCVHARACMPVLCVSMLKYTVGLLCKNFVTN